MGLKKTAAAVTNTVKRTVKKVTGKADTPVVETPPTPPLSGLGYEYDPAPCAGMERAVAGMRYLKHPLRLRDFTATVDFADGTMAFIDRKSEVMVDLTPGFESWQITFGPCEVLRDTTVTCITYRDECGDSFLVDDQTGDLAAGTPFSPLLRFQLS